MNYFLQTAPFVVPTTDGKRIEEHAGLASTGRGDISIAHMLAPAGWSEPHQTPQFDEWTLVSRGKKMFEIDGEQIEVAAGQSILVKKGARVRYSNPFDAECEYWSVCLPAFSIENVNREGS
jgi:mannose-6-phosphate isomerase-like protein (cupin superfamily)